MQYGAFLAAHILAQGERSMSEHQLAGHNESASAQRRQRTEIMLDRIARLREAISRNREIARTIDADLSAQLLALADEMETQVAALTAGLTEKF
jgi:hypothetical protein